MFFNCHNFIDTLTLGVIVRPSSKQQNRNELRLPRRAFFNSPTIGNTYSLYGTREKVRIAKVIINYSQHGTTLQRIFKIIILVHIHRVTKPTTKKSNCRTNFINVGSTRLCCISPDYIFIHCNSAMDFCLATSAANKLGSLFPVENFYRPNFPGK
jgi:hypothetical protein